MGQRWDLKYLGATTCPSVTLVTQVSKAVATQLAWSGLLFTCVTNSTLEDRCRVDTQTLPNGSSATPSF